MSTAEYMSVINKLAETNIPEYNILKLFEEMAELQDAIVKRAVKPNHKRTPSEKDLIGEIGDVELRLEIIKAKLGAWGQVSSKKINKVIKWQKYINEGKYTGKI